MSNRFNIIIYPTTTINHVVMDLAMQSFAASDPNFNDIVFHSPKVAVYLLQLQPDQSAKWQSMGVDGPLYVIRRRIEPYAQMIVKCKKLPDDFREDITPLLKLELQKPYLLYQNKKNEVLGIWFEKESECDQASTVLNELIQQLQAYTTGKGGLPGAGAGAGGAGGSGPAKPVPAASAAPAVAAPAPIPAVPVIPPPAPAPAAPGGPMARVMAMLQSTNVGPGIPAPPMAAAGGAASGSGGASRAAAPPGMSGNPQYPQPQPLTSTIPPMGGMMPAVAAQSGSFGPRPIGPTRDQVRMALLRVLQRDEVIEALTTELTREMGLAPIVPGPQSSSF